MRKISTLLMLFCAFVGSAWAGPTDLPEITKDLNNPIYYTIYNTRSQEPGGLMYYAGDNVGLKDGCTSLTLEDKYKFYFTGSHDEMYIHNAAANGKKLASVDSWTEAGIAWTVSAPTANGLAFGPKGQSGNVYWNDKNYATGSDVSDFTVWGATDGGSIFIAEKADKCIFPEAGKFYVIEAPLFFNKQGVNKGLLVNADGSLGWNTIDLTNKNCYWQIEVSEGNVALKNLGTGKYVNGTDMVDAATYGKINALGSNQFNIVINGTTVHANGHNGGANPSGNIVNYGGAIGSASAWAFVEKADPDAVQEVTVNYNFTYGGVVKYTQSTATLVGEEYPAITVALPFGVSATKPAGTIEAGDVTEGKVSVEIVLSVNLPFVPAADYASITNWYYLKFHANNGYYLYYNNSDSEVLNAKQTAVDSSNKDAYTWAFVGNPFDGFKVVNKSAGSDKAINAVENGAVVSAGTDNVMKLTASSHGTNGFYMQATTGDYTNRFNAQGNKVVYWTGADAGSTFQVEERDMTGRAELQALVDAIEAAAPNYVVGEGIGYHTQASVDAVAAAVAAAKTALAGTMTDAISVQHQTAINNAVAALTVNMPTSGALYRIKNVMRERFVSVDATGKRVPSEENNANASLIWTVEKNGEVYTIKNLNYGENGYMKSPNDNNLASVKDAQGYTLVPFGEGQFKLTNSGTNFVDYGGNKGLGAWGSADKGGDGAWYLIPATELDVTVTEAGYATLNLPFDVTLPNTVKAYAVETVEGGYASLVDKTDIPANQGAILEGAGTHILAIAAASSDWSNNKLVGTNVNTYVEGEAYVLGKDGEGAGFFKAALNKNEAGETGSTHFLNNANKAYLPATAGASLVLRFNFGGTTAIESVLNNGIDANAAIYDLSGRRVEKAVKGIYIQNGKKIIVK